MGVNCSAPLPFARVPATEYHFMAQALDAGMLGLMLPMVEDAAQAQTIADATHYPPLGRRGAGLGMAQDDYEAGSTTDNRGRRQSLRRRNVASRGGGGQNSFRGRSSPVRREPRGAAATRTHWHPTAHRGALRRTGERGRHEPCGRWVVSS